MNFEKAKEMSSCSPISEITPAPTPITTIKETIGCNYKTVREIDYILSDIEAQIFGVAANKLSDPGEDTLEAALIGTNKILNNILGRLHQFANRMGVET